MSTRAFSCKHIIYPKWKCILVTFLQRTLVPRFGLIFLKIWNLSCFVHFPKQYPNVLLSGQKFCWFSFHMFVNYLYYCFEYFFGFYIFYLSVAYPLPHQLLISSHLAYRHAYVVVFIGLIWLCLHAFWGFHYFFIKCYVFNSKFIFACNRCCCAVDPYDLSPTLCDSNTTSIC